MVAFLALSVCIRYMRHNSRLEIQDRGWDLCVQDKITAFMVLVHFFSAVSVISAFHNGPLRSRGVSTLRDFNFVQIGYKSVVHWIVSSNPHPLKNIIDLIVVVYGVMGLEQWWTTGTHEYIADDKNSYDLPSSATTRTDKADQWLTLTTLSLGANPSNIACQGMDFLYFLQVDL